MKDNGKDTYYICVKVAKKHCDMDVVWHAANEIAC